MSGIGVESHSVFEKVKVMSFFSAKDPRSFLDSLHDFKQFCFYIYSPLNIKMTRMKQHCTCARCRVEVRHLLRGALIKTTLAVIVLRNCTNGVECNANALVFGTRSVV